MYCYIYLLIRKYMALEMFKNYKNKIENQLKQEDKGNKK